MPIAFHDAESLEKTGAACFVCIQRLQSAQAGFAGALFFINARGEPLEFVYNRAQPVDSNLWRPADVTSGVLRRLLISLFEAARLNPALIIFKDSDIPAGFWGREDGLQLAVPVTGLLSVDADPSSCKELRTLSAADASGVERQVALDVVSGDMSTAAENLLSMLCRRGLLLEPFERAEAGLKNVVNGKKPQRM